MMYVAPGSIVGRLLHALLPKHSAESASAPMRHRDGWDEVETEGRDDRLTSGPLGDYQPLNIFLAPLSAPEARFETAPPTLLTAPPMALPAPLANCPTGLSPIALAAPLTAVIGLLTAYLLARQKFAGQRAFEFGTMLSFAIPGTVIGIAYVLAFNVPPIELTGTAAILVLCNVFRNMPVGVRAGIASMAQIDRSLDEASTTLGARGLTTLRRVLLPLLKPAVVAALVYSFVRAMTTVSAVIFLVSAQYEWATTYIINRVVNGDYGVAIAYSSVLIVLMLAVIGLIQWAVGTRRLGRRSAGGAALAGAAPMAGAA